MVFELSIYVSPRTRRAHSVTSATTINVNPSDESWYRFKNVIRNPNPPMSIIWMSTITKKFFQRIINFGPDISLSKWIIIFDIIATYLDIFPNFLLVFHPFHGHEADLEYVLRLLSLHTEVKTYKQCRIPPNQWYMIILPCFIEIDVRLSWMYSLLKHYKWS